MTATAEIRFYRVRDEFGAFSNFAPYPIWLDGKKWPTSEHYFQSQKFELPERKEAIRATSSPLDAARMGRQSGWAPRSHWDELRNEAMRAAVWAKFTQHGPLRNLLLSTGSAKLVEHTRNDDYWADGGDGNGKNMLGVILMEVRERIRRVDAFTCTEEWKQARGLSGDEILPEFWAEWVDLRNLLWEKHFQSLPPRVQELYNKGNHPALDADFADEAEEYAKSLENLLSSLDYVERVSADAYHDGGLVLTVRLNQKVSGQEYHLKIPELFMGFQVFVVAP